MTTSWQGYEKELEQLRMLARAVVQTNQVVDEMKLGNASVGGAMDMIVRAMKQPERPNLLPARQAGSAHQALTEYHAYLVQTLGLPSFISSTT